MTGPWSFSLILYKYAKERGAVVEWLERLDHGLESRCKVVRSRLGFTVGRLENALCQPSSEWVPVLY